MKSFFHWLTTISCLVFAYLMINKLTNQAEQIQQLKSYNTRRDRRLVWPNAPANVDLKAIAKAENDLGTPASLTGAVWFTENGPDLIETGSIRKTYDWAMTRPIEQWSSYEGAFAMNRLCWEWMLTTEDGKKAEKKFLLYAAAPYTSMSLSEQVSWASNIYMLEEKYRFEIHGIRETDIGTINKPSYGRLERVRSKMLENIARKKKVAHSSKGKKLLSKVSGHKHEVNE